MATQTDVDNYLTSIYQELSYYGDKLSNKIQIGQQPAEDKEIKFMLLSAYVDIADWYLEEWDDTTNNMFTVAEFDDIQEGINRITNNFHWLDLS